MTVTGRDAKSASPYPCQLLSSLEHRADGLTGAPGNVSMIATADLSGRRRYRLPSRHRFSSFQSVYTASC
jgi:hypothetical protein